MTSLGRGALAFTGLVFAVIGVGFLIVPETWARWVGIVLPSPLARIDLRATYGGFDLAFGIFLLACARNGAWLRPGLWACGLALAGFAAGRIIGMVAEGAAPRRMLGLLAVELSLAVLSFGALTRLPGDLDT